mmetsp:Transcript_1788/g.2585  ORF Transcript_1788/g.2585 Transcript_1788/m.2585 type:complete len:200 (-) Transcript_1788:19-618(-)
MASATGGGGGGGTSDFSTKPTLGENVVKGDVGSTTPLPVEKNMFFGNDTTNNPEYEDESRHDSQASILDSADDNDDDKDEDDDDDDSSAYSIPLTPEQEKKIQQQKTGFVKAFLDSTVPRDVVDGTVGIVKGDFNVQKKTLLHHATTSDEYDLFSKSSKRRRAAAAAARLNARTMASGGTNNATAAAALSRTKSPKELA